METWLLWLIAAVIFGVGEIATLGFFLGPFAIGALVAALVAIVGAGNVISLAAFLVVSIAALGALRPLARSHRRQPAALRTGTAALVGNRHRHRAHQRRCGLREARRRGVARARLRRGRSDRGGRAG